VEFNVGNLGPDWGPGVTINRDFGDGEQQVLNAEALRKTKALRHAYQDAKTKTILVTATEFSDPGAPALAKKPLGVGKLQIGVSPSPVSLARQLADLLFNMRFALALLIASVLYIWRYFTQKTIFGSDLFDYAQAFALGFAVSLAVDSLPQQVAQLLSVRW
jgi:hypothetical protein